MKRRFVVGMFMVACLAWSSLAQAQKVGYVSMKKETAVDMTGMERIFIGWVDMPLEDWALHGYETKQDWAEAITRLNSIFHRLMQTKWLAKRTVVVAQDRNDQGAADVDLQIKFLNVRVGSYRLLLSIHFVDPKSGAEIASIPTKLYFPGGIGGFEKQLRRDLDEVSLKLQIEVMQSKLSK